MNSTPSPTTSRDVEHRWLLVIAGALFLVTVLRCAWVSDDAYITFRTADNFLHGYGLRYNVIERVQAYTHPLWLLVLSAVYAITREIYFTATILCVLFSLAAVVILAVKLAPSAWAGAVLLVLASLSKAFVDYSTSGLENPLTHLLLAVFIVLVLRDEGRRPVWLFLMAGLLGLNRLDALLIVLPALAYKARQLGLKRTIPAAALGFSPLVVWELFSLLYYGFLFPNTAYAKLNTDLPRLEYFQQGLLYLLNSLSLDPVTLAVIAASLALVVLGRGPQRLALGLGMFLYLLYIIWIGGDFMTGRFLTPVFLCAIALLADATADVKYQGALLAVAGVLSLSSATCPLLVAEDTGEQAPASLIDRRGVADERRFYAPYSGLLAARRYWRPMYTAAVQAGEHALRQGANVLVHNAIGAVGFFNGPELHVIDVMGLADPLLARLPAVRNNAWRIGHFKRAVPDGYSESVRDALSRIRDPQLARFDDKLRIVTRGPVFSWERFKEIWALNTGAYADLIDVARYSFAGYTPVEPAQVSQPKREGTPWNATGNVPMRHEGIAVAWKESQHPRFIEVSLASDNTYQLLLLRDGQELVRISSQYFQAPSADQPVLHTQTLRVPARARDEGFDQIMIFPERLGNLRYSLGHLQLVP